MFTAKILLNLPFSGEVFPQMFHFSISSPWESKMLAHLRPSIGLRFFFGRTGRTGCTNLKTRTGRIPRLRKHGKMIGSHGIIMASWILSYQLRDFRQAKKYWIRSSWMIFLVLITSCTVSCKSRFKLTSPWNVGWDRNTAQMSRPVLFLNLGWPAIHQLPAF